jgi:hypothetical protein
MADITLARIPGGQLHSTGGGTLDPGVQTIFHGLNPDVIDDENWSLFTFFGGDELITVGALNANRDGFEVTYGGAQAINVGVLFNQVHTSIR